jgi:D-alanyl-D-alanine carboxypeptidase
MNQPNPNRRRSESAADRKPVSPQEQNPRVRVPDDRTARQGRPQNRQYGQGAPNGNPAERPPQAGMRRNPRRPSAGNTPAGMPGSRPGYMPDGSMGQQYPPYNPQVRNSAPGDRVPPQTGQMRNTPRANIPQGNGDARNPNRQYRNVPQQNGQPANAQLRQNSRRNPNARNPASDPELRKRERARAEMEQTVRARKKAEARASRQRGFKTVGRFMLYLLCAVFLVSLLVGGGVLIALFHAPDAPVSTGTISFYYGGTKVRTAEVSQCLEGGELYVCFNDVAEYLDMKQTGSANEMKFILRTNDDALRTASGDGTEESVTFYTDEHRVVINGQTELLDVPNILIGEEIWVSTDFLTEWMENLSVNYKPNLRTVKVSRILDEENSDPDKKVNVYLPISFRLKQNSPLESIEEDPAVGLLADSLREATPYELNFQTDLSEYEEYMNPQDDLRDSFLILVNEQNPLTASDVPRDLYDVIYTSTARNTQQLREYPMKALEALFKEMHYYGYYDMAVYSGYRSYDYQATIFEQYVQNEMASNPSMTREEAEALVLTYSTKPGTSEHQTGLAVDMDTMGSFTTDFAWTSEYYWLQENSWKFGFVLRYPSDKTDVTSISFEPWHYRYVGRYHAKIMHDNGLCLEEYIARISY